MRKAANVAMRRHSSRRKPDESREERRKQTPDEMALTAKNYRLAKELVGCLECSGSKAL